MPRVAVQCGDGCELEGDAAEVLKAADGVLRPLLANLLRDPDNLRFRSVRVANRRVAAAFESLRGARWLLTRVAGFVEHAEGDDGTNERRLVFVGSADSLLRADRILTSLEDAANAALRGGGVTSGAGAALAVETSRADEERAARLAEVQRCMERDAAEAARARAEAQQRDAQAQLERGDFADATPLLEAAKLTIHKTGRLRNASFGAKDVTLRRMRHGRSFACRCPPDALEAHWHVRTSNLLYSYAVHLSADASEVLHTCDEHGYQYNTLPGSEHFGRTVHVAWRRVRPNDADPVHPHIDHETPNAVVSACHYCGTSFDTLWI